MLPPPSHVYFGREKGHRSVIEITSLLTKERNRQFVKEKYGLVAYKPRMFVIIGRRGNVSTIQLRNIELDAPGLNLRTVTFYAHYDGQPVDKTQWKQDPWKPTLVGKDPNDANPSPDDPETRIYARSSSDDKASVFGLITALDAMQASHLPLSVNLKFFFEGEEEAGSPHLPAILSKYAGELQSDMWVICDGPTNQNGAPQLTFGSRGVVTVQITAFGPTRPLHSGHYGNWVPNPIVELAHLISKLRTIEGEITIPNFYAPVRPLTSGEQKALKDIPNIDDQLRTEFGMGRTEGHSPLAEQILKP